MMQPSEKTSAIRHWHGQGLGRGCYLFFAAWMIGCSQQVTPDQPKKVDLGKVQIEQIPLPPLPDMAHLQAQVRQRLSAAYTLLANSNATAETYAQASQLFHAHHLETVAVAGYQRATVAAPQDYRWFYLLGVAAKGLGMDPLARKAFAFALARKPDHAPSAIEWAEFEFQDGRFAVASEVYRKILETDGQHVMALWGLGQVAFAEGRAAEAVAFFDRVLSLDPRASMVHYSMAQAQQALGELAAAKVSLAKRGEGRPTMPDPLMASVLAQETTVVGFRRLGDQALRAGAYAEALLHYDQALALDPGDGPSHLNRGWANFLKKDATAAAADWEKVLNLTDKPLLMAQAHYNLGQLASVAGHWQAAASRYETALELHPEFTVAKLALAEVLRVAGNFSQALGHYQSLVSQNPGDPVARLGRGLCLIRSHQYRQAIATLREDVRAQPRQATFYHMLIRLLVASPGEGLRDGKSALGMMVQLTQNWQMLDSGLAETGAMVFAELGQFNQAIRLQQRALTMAKTEGESANMQSRLLVNLETYTNGEPCRVPWPDDAPIFTRPSLQPQPVLQRDAIEN